MRTLKFIFLIFAWVSLSCNGSWAQRTIHQDAVVTFEDCPSPVENVLITGSYSYHFVIKLNKEGFIERVHWNTTGCEAFDQYGNKVKIIDTGSDTYGVMWGFFNYPNASNEGYPIEYSVPDGWMNDYMPADLPEEGSFVNMSLKFIVNGEVYHFGALIKFRINPNGEITTDLVKTF